MIERNIMVNPTAKQIKKRRIEELCNLLMAISVFLFAIDACFFFGGMVALNAKLMIAIGVLGTVLMITALIVNKVVNHAKRKAI